MADFSKASSVLTHLSAIPTLDEQGWFIGSFGMFTDRTESRKAEEEILAPTAQLQQEGHGHQGIRRETDGNEGNCRHHQKGYGSPTG